MEWKKSNISQGELEKQQQAYIKEALEMAKKSMAAQFEKTAELERAEMEKKAAEKAEAERMAAEKAEAEKIAAKKAEAERIAAEKAEAERIAAEKAETERIATEKAEAERIAAEKAEAERIAAEKAEAERIAAEKAEAERIAAEKAETERIAAEKAEAERIAAEKAEAERIAAEKLKEELTVYQPPEKQDDGTPAETKKEIVSESPADCAEPQSEPRSQSCSDKSECCEKFVAEDSQDDIIDIGEIKKSLGNQQQNHSRKPNQSAVQNGNPPNFNRYINEHNRNQCNCPNCRRRRMEQQQH